MIGQTLAGGLGAATFYFLIFRPLMEWAKRKGRENEARIEMGQMIDGPNKIDQEFLDVIGGKKRRM